MPCFLDRAVRELEVFSNMPPMDCVVLRQLWQAITHLLLLWILVESNFPTTEIIQFERQHKMFSRRQPKLSRTLPGSQVNMKSLARVVKYDTIASDFCCIGQSGPVRLRHFCTYSKVSSQEIQRETHLTSRRYYWLMGLVRLVVSETPEAWLTSQLQNDLIMLPEVLVPVSLTRGFVTSPHVLY